MLKRIALGCSLALLFILISFEGKSQIDSAFHAELDTLTSRIKANMQVNLDTTWYYIRKKIELTERVLESQMRANTMVNAGEYYNRIGKADSALWYFQQSVIISESIGDTMSLARNLGRIGQTKARLGDNEGAIKELTASKPLFLANGDSIGYAVTCDIIGVICMECGRYPLALENLFEGQRYFESLGFLSYAGNAYNNIGIVYRHLENREQELKSFRRALAILKEQADSIRLGLVYNNLGESLLKLDSAEVALSYLDRAEKLYTETGYLRGLPPLYHARVRYYYEALGDLETAKDWAMESEKISKELKLEHHYSDAVAWLGKIARDQGQTSEAIVWFEEALRVAEQAGLLGKRVDFSMNLASLYEEQGNDTKALYHHKVYTQWRDSLWSEDKVEEITTIELENAFARQQLTDSLARADERRITELAHADEIAGEKRTQLIIFFVLGTVLVIVFFVIRAARASRRQATLLADSNQQLGQALKDKDMLFKEVHHRVKNNFQIVSSLLELQSRGIKDEKARALAEEGRNRVKSMALIHQRLYENDDLQIRFDEYITRLVKELQDSYGAAESFRATFDLPAVSFDVDTAIPLGLIVNELVTNAFKYGFTENEQALQISLKQETDSSYMLEVNDNGKGLPEGFDFARARSLGLRLVRQLSKQLHGGVTYSADHGCTFKVSFKDTLLRAELD